MTKDETAIIVGGSHAAAQLCQSLRLEGWLGRILVISDDTSLPYHRPPLSKEYLQGDKDASGLLIRSQSAYDKLDVEFLLNIRVEAIDRQNRCIRLRNGNVVEYSKLALCTGARARKLSIPGATLSGVRYLRDLADAEAIKLDIRHNRKAVIVGGGYIGLEVAALLRKIGLEVCILETMSRVLQRVTSEEVSAFYTRIHTEEGVQIETNVSVTEIIGSGRVEAVICDNIEPIEAGLVIAGIGVVPNVELALDCGLDIDNGIVVNEYAQTSDEHIFAAGDCTRHKNLIYEQDMRLESVPNATEQSKIAAASMCGKLSPYNFLPWFWSNQYDLRLQIAGLNQGYDEVVIRGDIEHGRSFTAWYLKKGTIIAADCMNRPKEFILAKKLIQDKCKVPVAQLSDDSRDLEIPVARAD